MPNTDGTEDRAMLDLIGGVQEFQAQQFEQHREMFEVLAQGQFPDALFITCSDSRVNPNLITQTNPGQLFILRNAGNIIPPFGAANGGEGATVEYAVLALEVEHIIVCGHSHCGAMDGLMHPEKLNNMNSVSRWLENAEATRMITREKFADLHGEELQTEAARQNVLVQINNLMTHPSVATRVSQGRLKLHAWMYHFETADVFAFNLQTQKFAPLTADEGDVRSSRRRDA